MATGTRIDYEIEQAQQHLAQLLARKATEEAAQAAAPLHVRELAVVLHERLCQDEHPADCNWHERPDANNFETTDWSQEEHQAWLGRALEPLRWMVERGWGLTPPGASEPLTLADL